jgi:anti-anti-sigma regulatory factor
MSADVAVEFDAGSTAVVVDGTLDADGARNLLRVAALAATYVRDPITVDLSGVESYTEEGIAAVTGCRRLSRELGGALTIRVRGGAGAQALMASLSVSP